VITEKNGNISLSVCVLLRLEERVASCQGVYQHSEDPREGFNL